MRAHQSHETDGAHECNGDGGQNRHRNQYLQPQRPHVDAQAEGFVLAQTQGGQPPHLADEHRHGYSQHDERDPDFGPGSLDEAAQGPEHHLLQRLLRRDVLEQSQQRAEQEHQGDAQQHHRFYGHTAQGAQQVDGEGGQHGEHKGVHRYQEHAGEGDDAHAQHQGQRGAEPGRSGYAEGEGTGQWVVQDGLHLGAGHSQGGAHHHGHQSHWHPDVPDNDTSGHLGGAGAKDRGGHLQQAQSGWAERNVKDKRERQQGRERPQHEILPSRDLAVDAPAGECAGALR